MDDEINEILRQQAQTIRNSLLARGLDCEILEFQESTRTSADAAARIGCQIGQIVKSLIFRSRVSSKPVLVLTSGANRVDEGSITNYFGEAVEQAKADFVHSLTGFSIGGVPPVGHSHPLETFIDEDLLKYEEIWASAGTPNAVFRISPLELCKITGGKVIKVKT